MSTVGFRGVFERIGVGVRLKLEIILETFIKQIIPNAPTADCLRARLHTHNNVYYVHITLCHLTCSYTMPSE